MSQTSTKETPKSCGCRACTSGKRSASGNHAMKADERAFRHCSNARVRLVARLADELQGFDHGPTSPRGGYYD